MTPDQELRDLALQRAIEFASKSAAPVDVTALAEWMRVFLAGDAPPRPGRGYHQWSDAETDVLRRLYPTEPNMQKVYAAVRAVRGREISRTRINAKAQYLGLHRPASCMTPKIAKMLAANAARRSS